MKKAVLVFGTRPEAIKMAPLYRAMKEAPGFSTLVVVTAQHRQMLDQVLALFEIKPDYDKAVSRCVDVVLEYRSGVPAGVWDACDQAAFTQCYVGRIRALLGEGKSGEVKVLVDAARDAAPELAQACRDALDTYGARAGSE